MRFKEGIIGTSPAIDKIKFEQRGKMSIYLEDGRVIIVPLILFPGIKKLSESQRRSYHISDGQIVLFKDCNEVYHLEQFLGSEQDYRYSFDNKSESSLDDYPEKVKTSVKRGLRQSLEKKTVHHKQVMKKFYK